jgi:dTDP-4-amino-4,6-dideoxygalactose transaminase
MFFLFRFHSEIAGMDKAMLEASLMAEGIPVQQLYPYPLYRNPMFVESSFKNAGCPVAEASCEQIVALPINVLMGSATDTEDVVSAVQKIYEHRPSVSENAFLNQKEGRSDRSRLPSSIRD